MSTSSASTSLTTDYALPPRGPHVLDRWARGLQNGLRLADTTACRLHTDGLTIGDATLLAS